MHVVRDDGPVNDRNAPTRDRMPLLLTDRGIAAVTVVMAVIGLSVMAGLLAIAGGAPADKALRIDAIKFGAGAIASGGALALLLLAMRRQRLAEQTQQHNEMDAAERRVTELYVKAADQLGSAQAPVRLAGLYALERLAQDNPVHRQTVVEVMCAYLRMPYTPPRNETIATDDSADADKVSREERQVRLAAQRILLSHLQPGENHDGATANPHYWSDMDVDLTEAVLEEFDFSRCHVRRGGFARVTFIGGAGFDRAAFTNAATFRGATFGGDAWFGDAKFNSSARFRGATFKGYARFDGASFAGSVGFVDATFSDVIGADKVPLRDAADLDGASFAGGAWFGGATVDSRPDRVDTWPAGWQVDESTWRLVRTPADAAGDD